ncbi:DNA polymerase III beta subunit [Rhodococcus phage Mbo2]|uniref:DNA polymerase III beta subunit n=1 Tax=Rhodococcus phage Mbo2 TaxID=2936911 RepID=A0A9E7IEG1_9CAUD|nr:DNA polymerase III beta subunit [Rhodococcus phage Mbo2]
MTRVVFETATIADALRKAERCAPKARGEGEAFGTAAGLVLEVRPLFPDGQQVRLRSTNTEIFYDEWVDAISIEGDAVDWRVSDRALVPAVNLLPVKSGAQVSFETHGGLLKINSARTSVSVCLIPMAGYPIWEPFDESGTEVVSNLGVRLSQVAWACDEKEQMLSGVRFTGTHLVATNRRVAAMVPCEIPVLAGPVTVSAKVLANVIKHSGDVRLGVLERNLGIAPDAHTQIKCAVYDGNYPDISVFTRIDYDTSMTISRDMLVETVQRLSTMAKGQDNPIIKMLVGAGDMTFRLDGEMKGESISESVELPGQADHFPVLMGFTPKILLDAISKCPDERIVLSYNSGTGKDNTIVNVNGGGGYEAWFVQTKITKNGVAET